jgi:thioesterase domain-containing protein
MAADRLPSILSAQPEGPYRLGGYCAGGLVAFEVARLLVASGRKVELVAMIDPPSVNARPMAQWAFSQLERIRRGDRPWVDRAATGLWHVLARLERIANVPPSQWWARTQAKARSLFDAAQHRAGRLFHAGQAKTAAPMAVGSAAGRMPYDDYIRIYELAMSRYVPAPLAARVIYFAAEFNGEPWRRLSSELELIKLSGDHFTVTIDPSEVADHFGARLHGRAA